MFLALFLLARAFRWDERWRTLRRSVLALALAALVFFRLYDGLLLVAVAVIAIRLRSLADPHAARLRAWAAAASPISARR